MESNANWLTPEMLSLFMFHEVRNLSQHEEVHIIQELVSFKTHNSNEKIHIENPSFGIVPNSRTITGEDHKFGPSYAWFFGRHCQKPLSHTIHQTTVAIGSPNVSILPGITAKLIECSSELGIRNGSANFPRQVPAIVAEGCFGECN